VALKLAVSPGPHTYAELAAELSLQASQVHAAVKRLKHAGLVGDEWRVRRRSLSEFLRYGVPYCFPPERGPLVRGIPTAHAAPPLADKIRSEDVPPVWPMPEGTVRGEALFPIHKAAPEAAARDDELYKALALVDAIRAGKARDREIASNLLKEIVDGGR
jgi:hypothetical protein